MSAAEIDAMVRLADAGVGFDVVEGDMGMFAVELALVGFEVFPLNGKVPAIVSPHPKGSPERKHCRGECGADGHGYWDATTDVAKVSVWWSSRPKANVGIHVPDGVLVVDVDPRHAGDVTIHALERTFGRLPDTLTTMTGGGGTHLWFQHPGGEVSTDRLDTRAKEHGAGCPASQGDRWLCGIDLKEHGAGYVVAPPSVHPDPPHRTYHWHDVSVTVEPLPRWFAALLQPAPPAPRMALPRHAAAGLGLVPPSTDGPADRFCATHTWVQVLTGWTVVGGDGEEDGSAWRHPTATAESSATIEHGLLFVYSSSTVFEQTTPGRPHGYTKFRAWAVLEHRGDLSAAARAWVDAERTVRR